MVLDNFITEFLLMTMIDVCLFLLFYFQLSWGVLTTSNHIYMLLLLLLLSRFSCVRLCVTP